MKAKVRSNAPASSPAAATVRPTWLCETPWSPSCGASVPPGVARCARISVCKVAPLRFAASPATLTPPARRSRSAWGLKSGATGPQADDTGQPGALRLLRGKQIGDTGRTLQRQQRALDVETTAETSERAIRADDTMTRHDDRQRVGAVRQSYRAGAAGEPDALRQLAIGDRLAVRDRLQCLPDGELKRRADGGEPQPERTARTGEILVQLCERSRERRGIAAPTARRPPWVRAGLEMHPSERLGICGEQQRAYGGVSLIPVHDASLRSHDELDAMPDGEHATPPPPRALAVFGRRHCVRRARPPPATGASRRNRAMAATRARAPRARAY